MIDIIRRMGRGVYAGMVLLILVLTSFMVSQVILGSGVAHVIGNSMEPTLYEGQSLLFARRSAIDRYDIVLGDFQRVDGEDVILIKRAIGLPGDDIAVIDGVLYLNGMKYDEPYIKDDYVMFGSEMFRHQLGPDEYFLMGDNRDVSLDSRNELGIVKRDKIKGVVKLDISAVKGAVKR